MSKQNSTIFCFIGHVQNKIMLSLKIKRFIRFNQANIYQSSVAKLTEAKKTLKQKPLLWKRGTLNNNERKNLLIRSNSYKLYLLNKQVKGIAIQ